MLRCQEIIIIQQETYYIIYTKKSIINLLVLSRQTNTSIPQQINFTGKLGKDYGATVSFIIDKEQKAILNLSVDSLNATE